MSVTSLHTHSFYFLMHLSSTTFNTYILSTLRTKLAYKRRSNRKTPTMDILFKSLFQHYTACFSETMVRPDCHTFQAATRPNLKLTSIHNFSKSLSYLRVCVLRELNGSRTILIYFKPTTY